ncbi:hypothetical protein KSP40_PGU022518 [Platanthera guangdongensis]|uniref:Uncharacterized protein n=1 Tax=Platanthera guangdongensis TaxID=2320717 RepID=A0ABR2MY09_9ASPA
MKLTVKTLRGSHFDIQVHPNDTEPLLCSELSNTVSKTMPLATCRPVSPRRHHHQSLLQGRATSTLSFTNRFDESYVSSTTSSLRYYYPEPSSFLGLCPSSFASGIDALPVGAKISFRRPVTLDLLFPIKAKPPLGYVDPSLIQGRESSPLSFPNRFNESYVGSVTSSSRYYYLEFFSFLAPSSPSADGINEKNFRWLS